MFDELSKYSHYGHFFLQPNDSLKEVCNAPTDKSGVLLVYALARGEIELVFIGCSGRHLKDGSMFIRSAGLGGMKDRIVNGHQFGKVPRHKSWPKQMKGEGIDALDVYWYVTHDNGFSDCPVKLRKELSRVFCDIYGKLPRWNKK